MSSIDIRHSVHPSQAETFGTAQLRQHFVIESLFPDNGISCTYLHDDRMIVMSCKPGKNPETFSADILALVRSDYFLERREIGIFNIGGTGSVLADGERITLGRLDAVYVGRGVKSLSFVSDDASSPAKFYMNSAPAHVAHPMQIFRADAIAGDTLGAATTANNRVLRKYIHPGAGPTCQLVMGWTELKSGNVWNTMPPHTHDRRMEVYVYFDLAPDAAVMHFMGRPQETRHVVMRNEQAVISPPWSIHAGAGTTAYGFIWSMAGENQAFADMDAAPVAELL